MLHKRNGRKKRVEPIGESRQSSSGPGVRRTGGWCCFVLLWVEGVVRGLVEVLKYSKGVYKRKYAGVDMFNLNKLVPLVVLRKLSGS